MVARGPSRSVVPRRALGFAKHAVLDPVLQRGASTTEANVSGAGRRASDGRFVVRIGEHPSNHGSIFPERVVPAKRIPLASWLLRSSAEESSQ